MLSLLESPEGYTVPLVRDKALKKIREAVGEVEVPCWSSAGLHEVLSFGLPVAGPTCNPDPQYLFTDGFVSKRKLKLCLLPAAAGVGGAAAAAAALAAGGGDETATPGDEKAAFFHTSGTHAPFVHVEFTNSIVREQEMKFGKHSAFQAGGPASQMRPVFTVAIEGGTVVAEGFESPRAVWEQALLRGPDVLRCLGSKLLRCRAVLNRLCISPLIVDFLEPFPFHVAGGADYYRSIKAPMWLKEVHSRLANGTYDNEFDFAWDVRLVFANCTEYNLPGSELYEAAKGLLADFEHLLCNWVYNVQDVSVDDIARGPWDNWGYLKYFDATDPKENFCRETGERTGEEHLHDCCTCEDQYLKTLQNGRFQTDGQDDSWICWRCDEAQKLPIAFGLPGYPIDVVAPRYDKDNFPGGWMFHPVPEFGDGWCQAKRINRQGLQNVFLSPLGYELTSKADAAAHKEFEKTVNDTLLAAREAEFKEWREQVKSSGGKKGAQQKPQGRHKRERTGASPERRTSGRSGGASAGAEAFGVGAGAGAGAGGGGGGGSGEQSKLAAAKFKVGEEVEANYKRRGKYFPGRITEDNGDGTFAIGASVCGCVAAWLCGCVAVWLCGCVAV